MTQAVTIIPCGHTFNEDTVIQCLARNKLCPMDRQLIERYVPNYTIRTLAATIDSESVEKKDSRAEVQARFEPEKQLYEQGNHGAAIAETELLQALQLNPTNKAAISKDRYIDLLLNLLDKPLIQSNKALRKVLEEQVEELMSQKREELTQKQQESYQWTQKLFADNTVRQFVAEKLQQIHAGASSSKTSLQRASASVTSSNLPLPPQPSVSPALSSIPVSSQIASSSSISSTDVKTSLITQITPLKSSPPAMAFGAAEWNQYFGDVGAEPPLPANIQEILSRPCPFWPGKKIQDTHLLVLVPQTVNKTPLTLKSLGELMQNPKQGYKTKYSYLGLGMYTDPPAPASHWVLMTREVLRDSGTKSYTDRAKPYAEQQALVARYAQKTGIPYQVPNVLDAATCIFMEFVRSGTCLYKNKRFGNDSPPYTRCQEKYDHRWQLVVGCFISEGLRIYHNNDCTTDSGVAASWKL
jgi:hypothetical protein